ncbi:unnamed protein product [Rotaria socialis]|uniref:Uncharacterized protein n=1 Tax=Rotaria socialis TaxID=392032 RepID=A0A820BZX4_9BILA|nr:unnamed protein product [Rotaria socialis]CAF3487813.1 unnamed protein product [Rotaria socialis]CAF3530128.1 unnamed protein product [Rotaria socialis]CAF3718918.1 unnamed protein product [Rotaria socialis]CAF3776870.1 unnamed protein product [Rotaria socialis]
MCSIESIRHSSHSTTKKLSNRKLSLRIIEKRLNHLREALQNLAEKEITNHEQDIDYDENYHVQYKKRLDQLLRLYDKQVNNLNRWRYYRSDTIEKMYAHELRQSDEVFQMKRIDFKAKLLSTFNDKRRHLEYEHQNVNIRHRQNSDNDQYLLNGINNNINDANLYDGHPHHSNESNQQQRPMYNLRRAAANDIISESSAAPTTASLKDLSIFSGTNSLLPPFGGIELQRSLSNSDIDQDLKDIHRSLKNIEPIVDKKLYESLSDDSSIKSLIDVRIEEGRLWYQRAWFSRNSPILLVFDDLEIVPALVLTVGRNDLLIRRSGTNIKHRVSLSLLHDGHLSIRKRGCMF